MSPPSLEDQERILDAFRAEIIKDGIMTEDDPLMRGNNTLHRFLRARQYDIDAAKLMLKNCVEWRRTVGGVGIDELYRQTDPFDYPERNEVFQHWPLWFHKTDKKGRPINIHNFGSIDVKELYKVVTPERFLDTLVVNCESLTREILPACSHAAKKPIGTVLVIIDLKDFGISQFWAMKDLVRTSFQISQDYFPETMGQVAIINAPGTFTMMWSAIRPWLAKETVGKVDILGSDYQQTLLALADAESLPAEFGGTCHCDGEGGCAKSNKGPWLDGRKQRKDAWLKRERSSIAIQMDEQMDEAEIVAPVLDEDAPLEKAATPLPPAMAATAPATAPHAVPIAVPSPFLMTYKEPSRADDRPIGKAETVAMFVLRDRPLPPLRSITSARDVLVDPMPTPPIGFSYSTFSDTVSEGSEDTETVRSVKSTASTKTSRSSRFSSIFAVKSRRSALRSDASPDSDPEDTTDTGLRQKVKEKVSRMVAKVKRET